MKLWKRLRLRRRPVPANRRDQQVTPEATTTTATGKDTAATTGKGMITDGLKPGAATSNSAATRRSYIPPRSARQNAEAAPALAAKVPPGLDTAGGGGLEGTKISFGDLGSADSDCGGGGSGDTPAVSPNTTRRERSATQPQHGRGGDADGDADVLEMLKHLPKLFLKDIMAHR